MGKFITEGEKDFNLWQADYIQFLRLFTQIGKPYKLKSAAVSAATGLNTSAPVSDAIGIKCRGWRVEIDLTEELPDKPFREISDLEPEKEWIRCWIEDEKFKGAGGVQKLEQIIEIFLNWTKE